MIVLKFSHTEKVQNVLCIWSNVVHLPKFDILCAKIISY